MMPHTVITPIMEAIVDLGADWSCRQAMHDVAACLVLMPNKFIATTYSLAQTSRGTPCVFVNIIERIVMLLGLVAPES